MYVFKFNTGTNTFTQLGSLTTYSSSGYNHSSALTPNGQTLVFTDEVPSGLPIKIANVSNLGNIQVVATTNQFSNTTPHNPFMVSNSLCFMSSYQDGTQLYNISNPSAPVLAGYFDTYPAGGGNNNNWSGDDYQGQWGMYPYFPSKNIFALDQKNGIFMLKSHLYQNPLPAITAGLGCVNVPLSISANTSTYCSTYQWSFPGGSPASSTATNPSVTYTAAGIYTISLLAGNQTTTTATITKTIQVTGLSSSASSSSASCGTCNDATAAVTFTGNIGTVSCTWSPTGGNTYTATNLLPGCYTVTLTDITTQCTSTATTCVGFITGVESSKLNLTAFSLYPNPASQQVTVELNRTFGYSVYNQLGQIVRSNKNNHQKATIDLNGLAKGIYVIEVHTGKEKLRKKLIVE
jgi:hypothetical protein